MTNSIKINHVILDLDDVLNSFTMPVMQMMGADVGPFDYHKYPVEAGYNLPLATEILTGRHLELGEFWDSLGKEQWAVAPKSKEFWLLDCMALAVGCENVLIGTTPTKSPECLVGKLDWITECLPSWCHRQWAITPRKWFFANENTLLIDDYDYNCEKFQGRGGHAIILPRPWNSKRRYCGDTEYLSDQLVEYFGRIVIGSPPEGIQQVCL